MNSRSEKFLEDETPSFSRTARNTELYKEISKTELDNYEVRSNATVIGDNRGTIDVERIKSILDTHYNDVPKRKSIKIERQEEVEDIKPIFETKEYDINVILDKAREGKEEDYNADRAKKLRDTQYDILNNLNIDPKDYIEDYDGDSESVKDDKINENTTAKELEELINTINLKEKEVKEEKEEIDEEDEIEDSFTSEEKTVKTDTLNLIEDTDPLDIFEDLKGTENTDILEGLQEKTENLIKQMEETKTDLDSSFFTKSSKFKKSDFEDFSDIEKETSPIVKFIIAVLIIIFIVGIVILVKTLL